MLMTLALVFFFNDTATTEIYTLSLHDALPIYGYLRGWTVDAQGPTLIQTSYEYDSRGNLKRCVNHIRRTSGLERSEEHTSELQSRLHIVCRLLLEKKKGRDASIDPPMTTNPRA